MRAVLLTGVILALLAAPASGAELRLQHIGTFTQPVYVTSLPRNAGTLAVVERYGRVRLVRHGQVRRRPLIDMRKRLRIDDPDPTVDQRGLLSIAFAPDYARSRRIYVDYIDGRGRLRVDEWRRGRLRHVLNVGVATTQHHGGQLQFGPDGLLYVSTGMADDPATSQDPHSLKGKLLRLNPRRRPARPEVVALGLRNPWRFSFDRRTGTIVIGDVGQDRFEEVDVVPPGAAPGINFGWPSYEGTWLAPGHTAFAQQAPALTHRHGPGWCSLMGGYVGRGRAPRALRGRYVYGDLCSGRLWSARLQGTSLVDDRRVRGTSVGYLVSFGQDARGRLYAVSLIGDVFRLR